MECRYMRQIWIEMANWLELVTSSLVEWPISSTLIEWWVIITSQMNISRKASRSLTLLVTRETSKGRNNHVFTVESHQYL
jgi:hypothetical protein